MSNHSGLPKRMQQEAAYRKHSNETAGRTVLPRTLHCATEAVQQVRKEQGAFHEAHCPGALECGGKRSATPLSPRRSCRACINQGTQRSRHQSALAAALCRRTPWCRKHSSRFFNTINIFHPLALKTPAVWSNSMTVRRQVNCIIRASPLLALALALTRSRSFSPAQNSVGFHKRATSGNAIGPAP
jgi:hypothetical protein